MEDLTNAEIRQACLAAGINVSLRVQSLVYYSLFICQCGAVTGSTRRLYLRKLSNIPAAPVTVTTKTTATANGAASAPSSTASTTTRIPRKSSSVSTRSKVGSRDAQFSEPEVIHDPPEEELDEAEVDEPKSVRKSGSNRKSLIPRSSFKVNTSQGQVDLEEKSDFELGELMKSIGLRFASIDSRNRPNYYRRIKDKLNHVTNNQSIDRTNEFRYYSIILIWKLKLKINFKAQTTTVKAN